MLCAPEISAPPFFSLLISTKRRFLFCHQKCYDRKFSPLVCTLLSFRKLPIRSENVHIIVLNPRCSPRHVERTFDNTAQKFLPRVQKLIFFSKFFPSTLFSKQIESSSDNPLSAQSPRKNIPFFEKLFIPQRFSCHVKCGFENPDTFFPLKHWKFSLKLR